MMQKNHKHFLSLIIPVYKQEKVIIRNLRSISKVLDKIRYEKKVRLNRPSQEIKNLIYYYEQQQKALFPRRYKKQ